MIVSKLTIPRESARKRHEPDKSPSCESGFSVSASLWQNHKMRQKTPMNVYLDEGTLKDLQL